MHKKGLLNLRTGRTCELPDYHCTALFTTRGEIYSDFVFKNNFQLLSNEVCRNNISPAVFFSIFCFTKFLSDLFDFLSLKTG